MNRVFKVGFLAFIPLFIIALSFIMSPTYFSEEVLRFLKPIEYICFSLCAVGLPIYFYWNLEFTVKQMLFAIGVMWGMECIGYIILGYWFLGLRKDLVYTLTSIVTLFMIIFLTGFLGIALLCLIGTVFIKFLKTKLVGKKI